MSRLTIDTVYLKDTLAELLSIASPTGYTDTIVRAAVGELRRLGLEMEITRRGAIRARLPGKSPLGARAMIAHLDTLGAQVKMLKPNGRLELVPVGNWSARFAEGARTTIFTDKGAYRGTILPLKASGHTFNEEVDTQPVSWSNVELRVDAIIKDNYDLERLGFAVGDLIAIDPSPEFTDNDFIVSRHLDDKAGVALLFATMEALVRAEAELPVDLFFIFSIAEEIGIGGASVLTDDIASLITIDNGTTAPGQNSSEFGVTIGMADQAGPFDWHLTQKLVKLCEENDIRYQKDIFKYYRSDSAAALEAGYDVRTALVTFGVDASHGYERIHMHALRSIAELLTAYAVSPVEIGRDREMMGSIAGFPTQPMEDADVFPRPVKPQV
ncbi:osmoprotectant NAGGN system M42 family peptidase [Acuticoccus sp. I52.16.1]|uniref:osmoprotectant NAGGN system M42 family peptidase n=1 Tax=Acuticoccus sp. I52.16.1 TaxID=2928472 RepID=UPI001FD5745A|nr:osmoprotectant NAGGN system M42 family peptidase [Acuticoccus sp. I52.16.1]UOM33815.1 osmoprotectant NAGGN system M42 family peptidase [Acuticoccus sp. I52.16.1]